ncbi:MAG: hypothetical protein ABH859_00375 [Pseudomonadota bacterium]
MLSTGEQRITLERIIDYYDDRICPSAGREEREVQVCRQTIVAGFASSYYQHLTDSGMEEQAALRRVQQFFRQPPPWSSLDENQSRILTGLFDRAALSAFSVPGNPATEEYESLDSQIEAYQTVLQRHRPIPEPGPVNDRHPVVVQPRAEQSPEDRRSAILGNLRTYLDAHDAQGLLLETQGNRIVLRVSPGLSRADAQRMLTSLNATAASSYIASQLRQLTDSEGQIYYNDARIDTSAPNEQAVHGRIISRLRAEIPHLEVEPEVAERSPDPWYDPARARVRYNCGGNQACEQLLINVAQAYSAYRSAAPATDHSCDLATQQWMDDPAARPEMSDGLQRTILQVFGRYFADDAQAAFAAFSQGSGLPRPAGIPEDANDPITLYGIYEPVSVPAPVVETDPVEERSIVTPAPQPTAEPIPEPSAETTPEAEEVEENEQVRAPWAVDLAAMISLLGGTEINAPGGFGGFSEHYPLGLQVLFRRGWDHFFLNLGVEYLYHIGLIPQDAEGNDVPRPGGVHDIAARFGFGYAFNPRGRTTELGFSGHLGGRWLVSDDGIVSGAAGVQEISYGTLDIGATFEVTHPISSRAYFFSSLRYSWSGFFEEELPGIEPGWINPISVCHHRFQLSLGVRIDIGHRNNSGSEE